MFWAGAVSVSSAVGASCELPSTEEEFDTDAELATGLHSPEAVGGVWVCFFLRSVSIQLELCLEAKVARAKDESLMFIPEVISSPNPS